MNLLGRDLFQDPPLPHRGLPGVVEADGTQHRLAEILLQLAGETHLVLRPVALNRGLGKHEQQADVVLNGELRLTFPQRALEFVGGQPAVGAPLVEEPAKLLDEGLVLLRVRDEKAAALGPDSVRSASMAL